MRRCPRGGALGLLTGERMSQPSHAGWTIAELSARVGMSIRNIRAHQSRGLVPPPVRRGRVAYYDQRHLRALTRILELQHKGYNLTAVEELLHDTRSGDDELLHTVLAPLLEGEEVVLTQADISRMFGVAPSAQRLRSALETGLLRDLGNGRFAAPSRQLLNATLALVAEGMSIVDVYAMQLDIARSTRDLAHRFVEACLSCAWPAGPERSDAPPEEVRSRFDELRREFTVVLAATFAVNVRRATEAVLAGREP